MHNSRFSINAFLLNNVTTRCFTVFHYLSSRRKFICNYDILGLTPSATSVQIKKAYYEKSKQYHPDMNSSPDAAVKFQQVNLAYEILSDDQLRNEYDYNRGYRGRVTRSQFYRQEEESDFNGDSPETAQFNRKVYSRLRKNATNSQSNVYETKQEASRAWQKIKHEDEFYDHLSADMKEAYQEYLNRLNEEKLANEERKVNFKGNGQESGALVALLCIFIVVVLFELIGNASGLLKSGSGKQKVDEKKVNVYL